MVVVVNRTLADRYWPGTDPVGRRIELEGSAEGWPASPLQALRAQ